MTTIYILDLEMSHDCIDLLILEIKWIGEFFNRLLSIIYSAMHSRYVFRVAEKLDARECTGSGDVASRLPRATASL